MQTPLFRQNQRLFADRSDLTNPLANALNVLRMDASGAASLLAHEQATPNMTLFVEPAKNISVGGVDINFLGGNTPAFTPPVSGTRTDLLTLTASGVLTIHQNLTGPSNYPANERAIAEVLVIAGDTALSNARITDVRQFFGGLGRPSAVLRESFLGSESTDYPTNTVFTLTTGSFAMGVNMVSVYIDGLRLIEGDDYTELSTTAIQLLDPALDTQKIEIIANEASGIDISGKVSKTGDIMSGPLQTTEVRLATANHAVYRSGNNLMFKDPTNGPKSLSDLLAGGGTPVSISRFDTTASNGQTLFNLSFSYGTGDNSLFVYVNGLLQRVSDDYTETDATKVTFVNAMAGGEKVTFVKIV